MIDTQNIGGKASSLFRLKKEGFNVPDFVVFREDEIAELTVAEVKEKISVLNQESYFAVRSSANLEDGATQSFAGVFETQLFVALEDVLEAIQFVFSQKNNEIVTAYLKLNKIDSSSLKLAVVVQEMIPAEVSGVAFGQDPTKPYKKSMVMSSVYGLGEGLVSGKLNADTFYYTKEKWTEKIAEKEQQLVFDGTKLKYQDLASGQKQQATLSKAQLDELQRVLNQLEELYGSPQDIEFCYANDELFILQSRPITTLKKYKEHTIWDNSNIIESYPGVTLPFTFSFILDIYESVYKNFGLLLGVPAKQIEANKEVFAEMLGHINGRVYYHLIHWNKALAMLPAYEINAGYMEKMMGVSEPLGVEFELKAKPSKLGSYWNLAKTLGRILLLNKRLPKLKEQFTGRVNDTIKNYKNIDYTDLETTAIWSDYTRFKQILINQWFPPLANDLLAMIHFGTLEKLCTKWLDKDQLHTELVVGRHPVKSILPAKLIQEINQTAKREGKLSEIQDLDESDIWSLCKGMKFGETGKLISKYIRLYGDRSVGELKLENETYTQNPQSFISILKSYDSRNIIDRTTSTKTKKEVKAPSIFKKIERFLFRKNKECDEWIELQNKYDIADKLPIHKRIVFDYVSKKAAETVADRENLRFDRTLAFGTIRMFLWEIGKRLEADGILRNFQDIFYLKENEIEQYFAKTLDKNEIPHLIEERKTEFNSYKEQPTPPERVHQYDDELDLDYNIEPHEGQLKGIPCCKGEVTGKIRILSNPEDVRSLNGDILVTTSTDPGWITIFQSASAILVERGSTLSHAAIVSREMGIPCIVGIKGLTQILKDGDTIKMNGKTGIVELYEAE
jgi:phosphoenolpyruvate synthase/pyruvate phosphate dikinase